MTRRSEMLGSTIQRELAQYIQRDISDPRLPTIVSVTRVVVSPDLEFADAYVTIMGTPGQQTAALNALKGSAGLMRSKLTKALSLRHAPFLRFQLDENLKKELAVLDLIELARRENEELDRKRAAAALEGASASAATEGASDEPRPSGNGDAAAPVP